MSTLLVDSNNVLIRILFSKPVNGYSGQPDYDLWRFLVFDNIYNLIKKFFGSEIVLAVDDRKSWRKIIFPPYKEHRKEARDKSPVDWDQFFKIKNEFLDELKEAFPFKILQISQCEADDIIGVLALNTGIKKSIVISTDEDYVQLLEVENVKVFTPYYNEFREPQSNFISKKILMGQSKDNIYNVKTPTNYNSNKRKSPLGEKTAEKILIEGIDNFIRSNNLSDNYKRNQKLIDFRHIPKVLENKILDSYQNYNYPDPENIAKFISRYNWREYVDNYTELEHCLLKLY
jgi:hypothetical protein